MGILDKAREQGRAAPAAGRSAAGGSPRKSRYAGLGPREGLNAFLDDPGTHIVEILSTARKDPEAKDPYLKTELKVLEVDSRCTTGIKVGDLRSIHRKLNPKSFAVTGPEIVAMTMAAFGFGDKQVTEFAEFLREASGLPEDQISGEDLQGLLLDSVEGVPEACEFYVEGVNDGKPIFGYNPLAGCKVIVDVRPVPPTPEYPNSRLSNYNWRPVSKG